MTNLKISLTFDGSFNVGSGTLGGSLADKPLIRDARGLPMIPASSFKGRLRHEVERLVPVLYPERRPPCASPVAEMMCQGDEEPCMVCQLFGSPWHPGKLVFSDFKLVEPEFLTRDEPPEGTLRYGVGLSRYRRVAEDQLLYTTEVFLPGVPVTLQGTISGTLSAEEDKLLRAALQSLFAVGGGKTQGLGWFEAAVGIEETPVVFPSLDVTLPHPQYLNVSVQLVSPLLSGTESNEAYYKTTQAYIPGSVLRGALARELTLAASDAGSPSEEGDFARIFGAADGPIFENLYPTTPGRHEFSFPAPLTARSCKYHPGFTVSQEGDEKNHGVGDILIRQSVFEQMLADPSLTLPALYQPHCPTCGGGVEPFDEFVVMVQADRFDAIKVPVRRTSRAAINRRRGVAEDGQLYTLEIIEPQDQLRRPTMFQGLVRAAPAQIEPLATQLTQVTAMGGSKTRGLGKVRITVSACDRPIPSLPSLQERLEAFNKKFRAEWAFYERVVKAQPLPKEVYFFSLDLLSPAVLTWHGIPLTSPTPEMLGFQSGVSLLRAFAGYSVAGGWHMGAKLPRRKQMTVDMGSVFLYRSEGYSLAELADRLDKLETDGLGAERARGFGRITLCLPFHYQSEVEL